MAFDTLIDAAPWAYIVNERIRDVRWNIYATDGGASREDAQMHQPTSNVWEGRGGEGQNTYS